MPTPKQEYAAALRDIANRFGNLEAATVERSIALLVQLRDRLQLQLTQAEGFDQFRIRELTASIDDLVARYRSQLTGEMRTGILRSSRLGAASVVEPLQAAGVASVGFFQPTPQQINTLLDFSADLIRGISDKTRQAINTEIRMAALGERSTVSAMQAVNRRLGITDRSGIAHEGERIIRTEMGRVFNVSEHSQQQVTARQVPELRKQWLATGDGRTRATHLAAHGQIRPIDEPFRVGFADLMFPLDPAGPPGETINCRCRMGTVHPEIGPVGGPLDARVAKELKRRERESAWITGTGQATG